MAEIAAVNLQSETSAGLRRAALALHSLRPSDRDWLLQQLARAEQQVLGELLTELSGLGIPPDAAVIRAALSEDPQGAPMSAEEARGLCLVLANEAPALQSLLLAALPESQRGAVLRHWPHELLARPSAVAGQAWTPALRDAVMQSWRELAQARQEKA
jgi:hypothetical protein